MRELEFRAYIEENGQKRFVFIDLNNTNADELARFHVVTNKFGVIKEQYTGLNDRNGEKIYEGDIVRCSFGESGVVELRHGAYCVVGDDITDMSNWKESAYEIIGNIHENPELLEAKNVD